VVEPCHHQDWDAGLRQESRRVLNTALDDSTDTLMRFALLGRHIDLELHRLRLKFVWLTEGGGCRFCAKGVNPH
jgi:hypothetical protein